MADLLELINRQLTGKGLKIEKAPAAVIDAAIIQTAGGKQRQVIETDENGVTAETLPGKDKDARWVKKDGKFTLGCKQHTRTDLEGYRETAHHSRQRPRVQPFRTPVGRYRPRNHRLCR